MECKNESNEEGEHLNDWSKQAGDGRELLLR